MSALISYALYIGIGMSAISIALTTATPYIEDARDTAAIQDQMQSLSTLEDRIGQVAQMAEGTQTTATLQIRRGRLVLKDDSLIYRIETESGIVTAGSRQDLGSITLSANARASLTETTYNGTGCYLLANDHIETCIRKVGTTTSFADGDLQDLILYIENRRQNHTIEPRLDLMVDETDTTATGDLRTVPVTEGQNLGTAHLSILVAPDDRPTYTVHINLQSGSDFLEVSTE
jgi:hypothetical protein